VIKKLRLRGFQSHLYAELEFTPGVNVIVGPTDSGKSSLVRALGWLIFNRPRGDGFVNRLARTCEIAVETDGGAASRSRKPNNEYVINGASLTAIGTTVPDDLQTVVHLDDVNFQWQLDPYFLVMESPGAISRYVTEQLGLDTVDIALKSLKGSQARLADQREDLKQTYDESSVELGKLSALDDWVRRLDEAYQLGALLDTVAEKRNELDKLSARLDDVSTALVALSDLEEKLDLFEASTLRDQLAEVCRRASSFAARLTELERVESSYVKSGTASDANDAAIEEAKQRYASALKDLGVCPTCFSVVDETTLERVVARL